MPTCSSLCLENRGQHQVPFSVASCCLSLLEWWCVVWGGYTHTCGHACLHTCRGLRKILNVLLYHSSLLLPFGLLLSQKVGRPAKDFLDGMHWFLSSSTVVTAMNIHTHHTYTHTLFCKFEWGEGWSCELKCLWMIEEVFWSPGASVKVDCELLGDQIQPPWEQCVLLTTEPVSYLTWPDLTWLFFCFPLCLRSFKQGLNTGPHACTAVLSHCLSSY